jgi:serine/threonine-protein kinase
MSLVEDGRLGKYVVVGTLGRGAMGTVYDARDPVIDRRVAIKTIPLASAEDEEGAEALARFKREAQAAGRLQHPNLVGVYDYGETDALAYIVMEFVDGTSLKAVLDKQERFTPADTVRIMEQVLAGLHYSHARGVVHRDIKPANIMLTSDGVVKIADFGIARIESSSLTQAGTIMGTPAYMSPEQFMGTTVDARTDIYSSGVMLYQMLTGERPFEGSMTGIMHKALNTEPPAPSAISVTSPVGLDAVVAKAMAKRPEQRFADAAAFAAALRAGLTAPVVEDSEATMVAVPARRAAMAAPPAAAAPPATAKAAGSRAGLYAGLGILALALAGGGAYLLLGRKPAAPPPAPQKMVLPPPSLPAPAKLPPQAAQAGPPPISAETMLSTATGAASGAPCAFTYASISNQGVRVSGIVDRSVEAELHGRFPAADYTAPIDWDVAISNSTKFCAVYDVLHPFLKSSYNFTLGLKDNPATLRDGAFIAPEIHFPEYGAYLTLDYIQSNGQVAHLIQGAVKRGRTFPPGVTSVFGRKAVPGVTTFPVPWQVGNPFGTDLLIAIASDQPLFQHDRPEAETVDTYIPALREAMQAYHDPNIKVAAKVVATTK